MFRYTCSPFCKASSTPSTPQAALETDLCTEAGVKEKDIMEIELGLSKVFTPG